MDLAPYVDSLRRDLMAAAAIAGDDAWPLAERLIGSLDAAARLALLDALAGTAAEITTELAPGSVEVRLRGREPEFVVTFPPQPSEPPGHPGPPSAPTPPFIEDDGTTARISLRLPDSLKSRIEEVAGDVGVSVNAFVVRALDDAVARLNERIPSDDNPRRRPPTSRGSSISGWAR